MRNTSASQPAITIIRLLPRIAAISLLLLVETHLVQAQDPPKKPNVLFIYLDDLNNWIGCMGGHPQVKTPNMDRLAARGMLFENSICPAPMCAPSRTATLTGRYPSTTGMYGWNQNFRMLPELYKAPTLPEYFRKQGWLTYGIGKVFGSAPCPVTPTSDEDVPASGQPPLSWTEFGRNRGTATLNEADTAKFTAYQEYIKTNNIDGSRYTFGPSKEDDERFPDTTSANWIADKIKTAQPNQSLFLVAGFLRPHASFVVPQKWFDMYPLESLHLPEIPENDLDDISAFAKKNMGHPAERAWFTYWDEKGERAKIIQGYLACVSFVDHCVGILLDALDESPLKDNTYIVLIGDNGFHLGEKQIGGKWSLWNEGGRTPMIIAGPGIAAGTVCKHPVDHVSIYPTLAELAGLPIPNDLDGVSIKPLLKNPEANWEHPALCTKFKGNHNLRLAEWSYIHYADGSEELYNESKDPREFTNLASNPEYMPILEKMRKRLPLQNAVNLPELLHKHRKDSQTLN